MLRDCFGIQPPKTREAIESVQVDEGRLRLEYEKCGVAAIQDHSVLYRIIGNDLPPRHEAGQSLRNLKFILENEGQLPNCTKAFVVNRILDPSAERAILDLLDSSGFDYLHVPFDPEEYVKIPLDYSCLPGKNEEYLSSRSFRRLPDRHKIRLLTAVNRLRNLYVMYNNGARNLALEAGLTRAKWVLPFDGNCFFTKEAWQQLYDGFSNRPWLKYYVVPMARIDDNLRLLDASFSPEADEEPQLAFRCDAQSRFNEAFPYGRFPKIEMFWHLGIPGTWSYTVEKAWDPQTRGRSDEAFQFGMAGWVARLDSGVSRLEQPGHGMGSKRGDARRAAILSLFAKLDHQYQGHCRFEQYLP